ncbi:hypothetical protein A2U01_0034359 [Trifolium medium]|uniref:Uncharacterized protein n=1 Tax=Trifolium medium TaxID=97028 RepID=A0A392PMC3_9FABA|nr:hypothetical protein [Trifolium medium]
MKRNSSIEKKSSSSKHLGSNSQILKEMRKPGCLPMHLERKMFLNTSTKPLLLRLTVTKPGNAHHLDVKSAKSLQRREQKGNKTLNRTPLSSRILT